MENLKENIRAAIEKIRPYLQSDGGDVMFMELTEDNVVKVKLTGACVGCPYSVQTLKSGIEMTLKREFPEITEVISV